LHSFFLKKTGEGLEDQAGGSGEKLGKNTAVVKKRL